MKKLLVIMAIISSSSLAVGQSMILDTLYFFDMSIDPTLYSNVWEVRTYGNSDSLQVNGLKFYTNSNANTYMKRDTVYQSGSINVEVLTYGGTVSATIANTNELTVNIPTGVRLVSMKVRVGSISSLKVFMGGGDMANKSSSNRWMPLVQAWREDTGQQLMGVTCLMDLVTYDKFIINGLINTTTCQIRVGF